jgi:hypothetical protein
VGRKFGSYAIANQVRILFRQIQTTKTVGSRCDRFKWCMYTASVKENDCVKSTQHNHAWVLCRGCILYGFIPGNYIPNIYQSVNIEEQDDGLNIPCM